eukprot:TRINITY_DN20907_c0_g1_i2.p1 TRINITY_DN20907_c0_g1~~TRINITY_DN20907_c0_g1_i2.p1  ORF type:complete len:173 (-),score=29.31 TRINITY_DN20907_c0_g1_i2:63-581(-)
MPRPLRKVVPVEPVPVDEVSAEEFNFVRFFWEYVYSNRPLLIKGGVKHWPAVQKWNKEYFSQWAEHPIRVAPVPADGVNVRIDPASEWNLPDPLTGDEDEEEVVQDERGMIRKDRVAVFSAPRLDMTLGGFLDKLNSSEEGDPVFYADGDLRSGALDQDLSLIHISEPTRPY